MKKEIRLAGTFIEYNNEILILHRIQNSSQGNLWGIPGGKVNPNEKDLDAAVREIWEETGYQANPSELKFHGVYDWEFPQIKISLPTYILQLDSKIPIVLNPSEHQDYMWVSPKECYKRNDLVHGVQDHLEIVYRIKPEK